MNTTIWNSANGDETMIAERLKPEMTPSAAIADQAHAGDVDAKLRGNSRKRQTALPQRVNFHRRRLCDLRHAMLRSALALSAKFSIRMLVILAWSQIFQVVGARVCLVAVFVIDAMALRLGANKGRCHKTMDEMFLRLVADAQLQARIAPTEKRAQDFSVASNTAYRTDFVGVEFWYRSPFFSHARSILT